MESQNEKNNKHMRPISNPSRTTRREFVRRAGKGAVGTEMVHFFLLGGGRAFADDPNGCMSGKESDDTCAPPANPDYCPGGNSAEDDCNVTAPESDDYCPGDVDPADECGMQGQDDGCSIDDEDCHGGEGDTCKPLEGNFDTCANGGPGDECTAGDPVTDECPGGFTADDVCVNNQDEATDYCGSNGNNTTDSCTSGTNNDDQCSTGAKDSDICAIKADPNNDICNNPSSGDDEQ